ncbi:MAG TPA: four helix bundle protein [Patescibacteria group bacterium]|nr:four helix bundle protein [Patescibacteria group bacterium]
METQKKKIESFMDLDAWKESHKLVIQIYLGTKHFPKEEIFGLVSQMRRAVISITSNIAEGFSRNSFKEKLQFYSIGLGSLTELYNQVIAARDIGYLSLGQYTNFEQQIIVVNKILSGLIKSTRFKIQNS